MGHEDLPLLTAHLARRWHQSFDLSGGVDGRSLPPVRTTEEEASTQTSPIVQEGTCDGQQERKGRQEGR